MLGKNHVALAVTVPLAASMLYGPEMLPHSVAAWAGLVVGSLAPDIDGGGSIARLGDWLPRTITPRPLVALLNGIGCTLSSVTRSIFGHRTALHWPIWGLLLVGIGWHWGLLWLIWFGVGYLLHIAGDALTRQGVPLLGPIRWNIALTPMKTGGIIERVGGGLMWLFVGWYVITELLLKQME